MYGCGSASTMHTSHTQSPGFHSQNCINQVWWYKCNPITREVEAGRAEAKGCPQLYSQVSLGYRPFSYSLTGSSTLNTPTGIHEKPTVNTTPKGEKTECSP